MEPVTTAALISGAAQIVGGLLGGDEAPAQPTIWEQANAQLWHDRNTFNQKMELAKQHGIHPLSVLGVPTANFSPIIANGGQDTGPDYAQMAHGAGTIARSFVKPPDEPEVSVEQRRMESANLRIAEANANRAEWDALRSQFQAQDMVAPMVLSGQAGNPPAQRMSNDVINTTQLAARQAGISPSMFSSAGKGGPIDLKQEILPPHPLQLGTGAGTDQTWINVIDQNGKMARVLNPKAIQAEFEQGATLTALSNIYGPDTAIKMAAVLENSGVIGGALGVAGLAGKKIYDYFKGQANRADSRRGYGPGRGRGAWRAAGPRNE